MTLDETGIEFICVSEGFSAREYLCEAGAKTIGFGHLVRANEDFSAGISREAAKALLLSDLQFYEACVNQNVRVAVTQSQYNALVSLCYNIGTKAFGTSTLVKELNSGHVRKAADEFLRWKFVKQQESAGLLRRRQREREMFLQGVEPMGKFFSVTSITAVVGMLAVVLGFFGVDITAEEKTALVTNTTEVVSGISFLVIFVRNIITKLKAKK